MRLYITCRDREQSDEIQNWLQDNGVMWTHSRGGRLLNDTPSLMINIGEPIFGDDETVIWADSFYPDILEEYRGSAHIDLHEESSLTREEIIPSIMGYFNSVGIALPLSIPTKRRLLETVDKVWNFWEN